MKRDRKKWFIILCYGLLLAACFGIVFFLGELTAPQNPAEHTVSEEGAGPEGNSDITAPATPSDAEETEAAPSEAKPEETFRPERFPEYKREEEPESQAPEPEPYKPPVIMLASDLHYYSLKLTDFGAAFEKMEQGDDGKALRYVPDILDAFLEEAAAQKPSALVLSGDLTFNGEKAGHGELAKKLKALKEKGVPVLVIPGNHDINNHGAAAYFGKEKTGADSIDAEEFRSIYQEFGYNQALSEDGASLSYVYPLDEKNWLLMLDSCQYEPENMVGGRIKAETLEWMEEQLKLARESGVQVIPVAHHNLLKESGLYSEDCTMENSGEVRALLERFGLPLFISGHLHLQRVKKYRDYPGEPEEVYHISEIVSTSVSLAPCRYGILKWTEEGGLDYHTQDVDVSGWAAARGVEEEALLDFKTYGADFLTDTVAGQIEEDLYVTLPREQIDAMTKLYGGLNRAYCAGEEVDGRAVRRSDPYRMWERYLWESPMFGEINRILKDSDRDQNRWSSSPVPGS